MCAAPNNFNPNLGLIQPTVPSQQNLQASGLQQFGGYPVPPLPLYPGLPGYPPIPPGYPAIPIPIPLPQNNNNNSDNKSSSNSDDRHSSKRSRDSKSRSHGSHRRSRDQDGYRDRKRGRDRDHNRFESQNKRPIHTVFFCNIPFEVNYDEFRDFAAKFGEISNVYPIFEKGIAFVTYNDIRDAQKAVYSTDAFLRNRKVKRDFASKPPDHARKNPCDTCSTVLVTSLEDVSKIKADDVIGKMREFGEIRSTSQDRPRSGEFIIKFFKLKDAKNCVDHNGLDLRHETLKIEYLPDEDEGEDTDYAKNKRDKKYRSDSDNSDNDSDSASDHNSSTQKQPQQQQLQQQQLIQMQMQYQQMQLQQLQQLQLQQLQNQYATQPIPPPPPLTAATSAANPASQPPQPTAFPPYQF